MVFDYHMHSKYSIDSEMLMEEACVRAIELNLDEIAFTDHIDIDWPDEQISFCMDDMEGYFRSIDGLRRRFRSQLKIKAGIEVGLQHHVLDETASIINKYPFDFVIASVHLVGRMDPYKGEYYKHRTKEESYTQYYREILHLINEFDDFDVLGHMDYIKRYSTYEYQKGDHLIGKGIIDEILNTLIKKGKGIEVNTSGYRHSSKCPMPHFDIVRQYYEMGGKIITLGSDAHSVEYIGFGFDKAIQGIKEAGFTHLTSFSNRKPKFIGL